MFQRHKLKYFVCILVVAVRERKTMEKRKCISPNSFVRHSPIKLVGDRVSVL